MCRCAAEWSPQPLSSTHPSCIPISCEGEYYMYVISWKKMIHFEIKEVRRWRKENSSALWAIQRYLYYREALQSLPTHGYSQNLRLPVLPANKL